MMWMESSNSRFFLLRTKVEDNLRFSISYCATKQIWTSTKWSNDRLAEAFDTCEHLMLCWLCADHVHGVGRMVSKPSLDHGLSTVWPRMWPGRAPHNFAVEWLHECRVSLQDLPEEYRSVLTNLGDAKEIEEIGPSLMFEVMQSEYVPHKPWNLEGGNQAKEADDADDHINSSTEVHRPSPPETPPRRPSPPENHPRRLGEQDGYDSAGEAVEQDGYEVLSQEVKWDESENSQDLEGLLRQVSHLSEAEVAKHASYLREEAYTDMDCLFDAMHQSSEWAQIKLPLRVKCALKRILQDELGTVKEEDDSGRGLKRQRPSLSSNGDNKASIQNKRRRRDSGCIDVEPDLLEVKGEGLAEGSADEAEASEHEDEVANTLRGISNSEKKDAHELRNIFVGGGLKGTSVAQVRQYFKQFGRIEKVQSGFMLLRFANESSVTSIIEHQGGQVHAVNGVELDIWPVMG
eukprot:gnl/MRDRNA2_/MRDRNA2_85405_c0_seq7.p1 gnl/MRDRNA2_/MRDRNA2_85405_c0~~gnl/MRDRNA2_/MRDRNA2_85405_c0_seq7.p1  ORF type:complete len:461 (+),score=85.56 gnl/MRDRNA2_/MRDRNA2_85405_c0_seq7:61-1443(+)